MKIKPKITRIVYEVIDEVNKELPKNQKIANKALPDWVTDNLLVFYLNNIRRSR